MKSSHPFLRGTAVAAAAAVMITTSAHGAPKKPEPAPVVEQATPEKKGTFGKLKSALSFKKKKEAPVVEPVPVEKAKPQAVPVPKAQIKPLAKTKAAKVAAEPKTAAVEETVVPEKKGLFKKLFTKSSDEAPAEPKLAKAKTAKPAPVKEVKLAEQSAEEPQKKRGLFGFLRGGSPSPGRDGSSEIPDADKIVRPSDWNEHHVVQDDEVAIYSFGPSQPQGPDERLTRGTLVKVNKITKGWALVEVHGGRSGYLDASLLRAAEMNDFADPPAPAMASLDLKAWAPAPPPPDLPDQPGAMDNSGALLLLPPLELEPKP